VVFAGPDGNGELAVALELDFATERLLIWRRKAEGYAALRAGRAPLYGFEPWVVLAVVPSLRRARFVARAVVQGGAGRFVLLGIGDELTDGRFLDRVFRSSATLAANADALPDAALSDLLQRPPPAVGGSAARESRGVS
jgi:hypothetical protein